MRPQRRAQVFTFRSCTAVKQLIDKVLTLSWANFVLDLSRRPAELFTSAPVLISLLFEITLQCAWRFTLLLFEPARFNIYCGRLMDSSASAQLNISMTVLWRVE